MIDLDTALRLIPVDSIQMHEEFEITRFEKTFRAIKNEKVLINPVIVKKISNNDYLLIDGVHRFLSLKELNCKYIVCQVIEFEDINLHMWAHLVQSGEWINEINNDQLFVTGKAIEDLKFVFKITNTEQKSLFYYCKNEENIIKYVNLLHEVVGNYKYENIHRVSDINNCVVDRDKALIEFYKFRYEDIVKLCSNGNKLPTGITRFSIKQRVLNVRIPIEYMENEISGEKWGDLLRTIQLKLRYYPESVYVCE